MKRILLVDSYYLFYRSHYAFVNNPLTNSKGEETSVIVGFTNTLISLLGQEPYEHIVLAMDSKGKTFRHELYPDYKSNRPPMPEPLRDQISFLKAFLLDLGLPIVEKTGFEADDLIGTYSKEAKTLNYGVHILSSDKDLMQLVEPSISMLKLGKFSEEATLVTPEFVANKVGVEPKHISDYLALVGDPSDHVPGVAGVGPKRAANLIHQHGTIEDIYDALDAVEPASLRQKLQDHKKDAFLSKELTQIDCSIPGLPELPGLQTRAIDFDAVKQKLAQKECNQLLKRLSATATSGLTLQEHLRFQRSTSSNSKGASTSDKPPHKPTNPLGFSRSIVRTPNEFKTLVERSKSFGEVTFDLETTSLDPQQAKLVAAVFVLPNKESHYIRFGEEGKAKPFNDYKEPMKQLMEDDSIRKIGHNLKFEWSILRQHGIDLRGTLEDTLIREYLLFPTKNQYKLESIIASQFGVHKQSYQELAEGHNSIGSIPSKELEEYTFQDGEYTHMVYLEQKTIFERMSKGMAKVYYNIDMPLIPILGKMEFVGVELDTQYLKELEASMGATLVELEQAIVELAGKQFNVNSTKQLQDVLFGDLGIKPIRKTKTGYSTDTSVLEKLSRHHEIASLLLQQRRVAKLLNTYISVLPSLISPTSGRLHTHYSQTTAASGRLSSQHPNLQNIPVKSKEGRQIRRAFKSPSGMKLVSLDYSQVELRVLAKLSGDPNLLRAYTEQRDIHNQTASLLFGVDEDNIEPKQRHIAKTVNFSVIYGVSAFMLGESLGLHPSQGKVFIERYFECYSGVRTYIDQVLNEVRQTMVSKTHYERERPIADINSKNHIAKAHAERTAFNNVIQGTASDIIKLAMQSIDHSSELNTLNAQMVMQVHDELIFYIEENDVAKAVPILKACMEQVEPFENLLEVNAKISDHLL